MAGIEGPSRHPHCGTLPINLRMVADLCAPRRETSKAKPEELKALFFRSVELTSFMKYFSDFSISCWRGVWAWCWLIRLKPTGAQTYCPVGAAHMRLDADDSIDYCAARRLDFSVGFMLLVALPCLWQCIRPQERECNLTVVCRSSLERKCESHWRSVL